MLNHAWISLRVPYTGFFGLSILAPFDSGMRVRASIQRNGKTYIFTENILDEIVVFREGREI